MKVPTDPRNFSPLGRPSHALREERPERLSFDKLLTDALYGTNAQERLLGRISAVDGGHWRQIVQMVRMQMSLQLFRPFSEHRPLGSLSTLPVYLLNPIEPKSPPRTESDGAPLSSSRDEGPRPRGGYEETIGRASRQYGVDPKLIKAVIRAESDFNAGSVSPKGAIGLMQLMPETARDLGVRDPFDPSENIMGGTRYLRSLLDRYAGDVTRALAAYNWGMGNVERHPGRLPQETQEYIARVNRFYHQAKS